MLPSAVRSGLLLLGLAAVWPPLLTRAAPDTNDVTVALVGSQVHYGGCGSKAYMDAWQCDDMDHVYYATGTNFVWVVVTDGLGFPGGIGGAQFGVRYEDADVVGWTLCTGGSEIPGEGWPASGTGNAVTWHGGCYEPTGIARVGHFTVGNTGFFEIRPDPRVDDALIADCNAELGMLCDANLGVLDIATPEYITHCGDHCDSIPVRESSWTSVKSLYSLHH